MRCQHGFLAPLCAVCHLVKAPPKPAKRRGDPSRFHHPGFVDEAGRALAGCTVLRRAANVNGNARWLVRAACGHEVVVEGIALRDAEKHGRVVRCKACKPKRPGTVRRSLP
jgi:hypothetical protein